MADSQALVPFNREDPPMQDPVRIAAAAARAAEVIQRNPFGIWAPDGLGDFVCLACHRVSHWGRPDDHKPDCQWNDLLVALGHPAAHRGPPVR